MLHIYPVILAFVEEVAPIIGRISRCDPDLARQLRRSSASVVPHRRRRRPRGIKESAELRERSEPAEGGGGARRGSGREANRGGRTRPPMSRRSRGGKAPSASSSASTLASSPRA